MYVPCPFSKESPMNAVDCMSHPFLKLVEGHEV